MILYYKYIYDEGRAKEYGIPVAIMVTGNLTVTTNLHNKRTTIQLNEPVPDKAEELVYENYEQLLLKHKVL
jgi:hypothetical protein